MANSIPQISSILKKNKYLFIIFSMLTEFWSLDIALILIVANSIPHIYSILKKNEYLFIIFSKLTKFWSLDIALILIVANSIPPHVVDLK